MNKNSDGLTIFEKLIGLLIVVSVFYYILVFLENENIPNKIKNIGLQSAITRMVVSTDGFISTYGKIPNEEEFLKGLSTDNKEFKNSCAIRSFATYECLFRPESKPVPQTCDQSNWRSDDVDYQQCNFRYYGGPALRANFHGEINSYRIYVKAFGDGNEFYVFDSSSAGVLYKCPDTLNDLDTLKECNEL